MSDDSGDGCKPPRTRSHDHDWVEPKILRLTSSVNYKLEEQADELLAANRDGTNEILSQDQLDLRARREISNSLGVADASLVKGMYRRTHNPLSGSRPGRKGHSHDDG